MAKFNRRGFLGALAAGGVVSTIGPGNTRTALAQAGNSRGLRIRGEEFVLDGEPFQILAGTMHYFRVHPDRWQDRLRRLRAMGLNTVESYIAWNAHEPRRGAVDFTGFNDIARFARIAEQEGLKVILRPGPYICAEWDFGGLPAWLLHDPDQPLRCQDPTYVEAMDAWFDQLLPRLAPLQATRGGPLIAVQVENEYGSYGNDRAHLEHIRDSLRAHGIDSLLFCSNGSEQSQLRDGNLPDVLATVNFSGDPDEPFAALRSYRPHEPLWCTEYWDGWFDHWGEKHHHTDPVQEAAHIEKVVSRGASITLYMAAGGTNFGWYSGANTSGTTYQPTVTSYDYDAPVGESGELTEKFHRIRDVLSRRVEIPPGPLPSTPSRLPASSAPVDASVGLFDVLDDLSHVVHRPTPVHMERLGQSYGLIHYRTQVRGSREAAELHIRGLADRALVFADQRPLAVLERNAPQRGVRVEVPGQTRQLDILVDANGRVNFGEHLNDPKGIRDRVVLGGQTLFDWGIRPLPLDNLTRKAFSNGLGSPNAAAPSFHHAVLRVGAPADGFLALPGWGKGMVWLNGFALGRYWNQGPQRTLYAPAPLWHRGDNEVLVMELHQPGSGVEVRSAPDLG